MAPKPSGSRVVVQCSLPDRDDPIRTDVNTADRKGQRRDDPASNMPSTPGKTAEVSDEERIDADGSETA